MIRYDFQIKCKFFYCFVDTIDRKGFFINCLSSGKIENDKLIFLPIKDQCQLKYRNANLPHWLVLGVHSHLFLIEILSKDKAGEQNAHVTFGRKEFVVCQIL